MIASLRAWGPALLLLVHAASAAAAGLALDPATTQVRIGLDSTLHRIEGTAHLAQGAIAFEPGGGPASGRIVVDARSVETGNGLRDDQLHAKVLESVRFPEIVFLPGALRVLEAGPEEARIELVGEIEIHGRRHPLAIPATVRAEGGKLHILAAFDVPHVAWGMRDMSNLLWVIDADGARRRLDEILGPGFALVGLDVDPAHPLMRFERRAWARRGVRWVTLCPPGVASRASGAVQDVEGVLLAAPARPRVLPVRPDRFVALDVTPRRLAWALRTLEERHLAPVAPSATAPAAEPALST